MRVSQLLTTTLREAPRAGECTSQELLVRAGFVRQVPSGSSGASGFYSILPLGMRVIHKLEEIGREEMGRLGAQEVSMPALQPAAIGTQYHVGSGLVYTQGPEDTQFRLTDRKGREMVLGSAHASVATLLAREFVRSYRDLPRLLYQMRAGFRDELQPRAGLLRAREFLMQELYSFAADEAELEDSYQKISKAYDTILRRWGLRYITMQAGDGSSEDTVEFLALAEAGEDLALLCDNCNYAACMEKAAFKRTELVRMPEAGLEEVYTPNCMTISDLAAFLQIPAAQTIKSVCYSAAGRLILVAIRGDLEVSEAKLTGVLYQAGVNAAGLHLATPEELARAGIIAGYTSPLGKGQDVLIVADYALKQGSNFVAGADRSAYHVKNVNYPRDFRVDIWQDIASAYDGATCICCGGTLHAQPGYRSGYIYRAGTRYSKPLEATYLAADGMAYPLLMSSSGIDYSRIMAAIVEQSHDAHGIIWPFAVAPYHVALVGLDLEKAEISQVAEQLYIEMQAAGIEVLFDDRRESAGVKFNDVDLIGLPLRAVISKRSCKRSGIELKARRDREGHFVGLAEAVSAIKEEISRGLISERSHTG